MKALLDIVDESCESIQLCITASCELVVLSEYRANLAQVPRIVDVWDAATPTRLLDDESVNLSLAWCVFAVASVYYHKALVPDMARAIAELTTFLAPSEQCKITFSGHTFAEVMPLFYVAAKRYDLDVGHIPNPLFLHDGISSSAACSATAANRTLQQLQSRIALLPLIRPALDESPTTAETVTTVANNSGSLDDNDVNFSHLCLRLAHSVDNTLMPDLWRMRLSLRILAACSIHTDNPAAHALLDSIARDAVANKISTSDSVCCKYLCETMVAMRIPISEHIADTLNRHIMNCTGDADNLYLLNATLSILSIEEEKEEEQKTKTRRGHGDVEKKNSGSSSSSGNPDSSGPTVVLPMINDIAFVYLARIQLNFYVTRYAKYVTTRTIDEIVDALVSYCNSLLYIAPSLNAKLVSAFSKLVIATRAQSVNTKVMLSVKRALKYCKVPPKCDVCKTLTSTLRWWGFHPHTPLFFYYYLLIFFFFFC